MGGYNSCIYLGMMLSSLGMGALVGDLGFRNCFFIVAPDQLWDFARQDGSVDFWSLQVLPLTAPTIVFLIQSAAAL